MASKSIKGLTIEIGGDTTKLGKALEDVDKKSRDLSSELGQINKLLKLDPGNTELLAQKQKVLAEAVSNTASRLDTLKEAEKQVQKQFERGEVSEDQVRALQREIISTEKKMESYEGAIKETTDQLEHHGKTADEAREKTHSFGEVAASAGKVAATGFAAAASAAAAAAAALVNCSVEAAAYADNILTQSTVTGIATDKLQAYGYAAELVDVSVETMTKSMAKNIKSMKAVQDGTKLSVEAYEKLGVSVTNADGSLRDGETVYWEVIDALGKMENETERDALAMQILGKSAQELNPLIEAGSARMAELTQEAKDVGAVLSEDSLNAMGAFDDSLQRLNGSAGAAKNALGAVLLPELTMLATEGAGLISEFTNTLNASGGGLDGFIATVDSMAGTLGAKAGELLGGILSKVSSLLPAVINVAVSLVASLAESIISQAPMLIETGIQALVAIMEGLTSAIPLVVEAVVAIVPQLVDALVTGIPQLIDGALQLLLAILDAIPLLINQLIPAIPPIVMSIIKALLGANPQLIKGALQLLLAIVDAIPLLIDQLVPAIPEIVTTIILALLDCTPQLIEAGFTLLSALSKAIPGACKSLLAALPQIWNTMQSYFKQLPEKLLAIGKSLVEGLWNGIKDRAAWLKEKITGWVGDVTGFLKKLFGINSPSKVTAWMGEMLDEGLAKGIEDHAKAPLDAMGDLTDEMLGATGGMNGLAIERRIQHSFAAPTTTAGAEAGLAGKLDQILEAIKRGQVLVINGDTLVGATANAMNSALGQRRILAERGAV